MLHTRFGSTRSGHPSWSRGVTTAASALLLTAGLAACGGDEGSSGAATSLDALEQDGTVRIAVSDTFPVAEAADEPGGVLPEVAAMVFEELGVPDVETVPMEHGAMIPSVQSGRVDVAGGGLSATAERCDVGLFSNAVINIYDGMAVAKGNPLGIKDMKDVATTGARLGTISGSGVDEFAKAQGVGDDKVQQFADMVTMLDALKADRIDAASFDNFGIAYQLAKPAYADLDQTEPAMPNFDGFDQPYAQTIVFPKDADELVDAFNEKLAELQAEGAFDEIMEKYSVPEESIVPSDQLSSEEVCARALEANE